MLSVDINTFLETLSLHSGAKVLLSKEDNLEIGNATALGAWWIAVNVQTLEKVREVLTK